MKIEHFALQVSDPTAMADWYVRHLGCSVARSGGAPAHGRFLLDDKKTVMLEIYCNPSASIPDYTKIDPLLLHLAFLTKDLKEIATAEQDQPRPVFLLAYIAYNTGEELKAGGYLDLAEKRMGGKDPVLTLLREHWTLPLENKNNPATNMTK